MPIFNQLYIVLAFHSAVRAGAGHLCLHSPPLGSFYLAYCNKIKHDSLGNKVPGTIFRRPFNQIGTSMTFHSQSNRFRHIKENGGSGSTEWQPLFRDLTILHTDVISLHMTICQRNHPNRLLFAPPKIQCAGCLKTRHRRHIEAFTMLIAEKWANIFPAYCEIMLNCG